MVLQELQITKRSKPLWPEGWRSKTCLMGVINITPDSFSDGGFFLNPKDALLKARSLYSEGVDVIDLGAQSTKPGAESISTSEELKRIVPVLSSIRKEFPKLIISVDTFNSSVAKECLDQGANWINDISGGRLDERMWNVVSDFNCPYVITHSRGSSKNMDKLANYIDVVKEVYSELEILTNKAIINGINPTQIIWDPGLGFAKTVTQNITLINSLEIFKNSNYPLLVGPSRKRFIGEITKETEPIKRIWGTAAVVCKCVEKKVDLIRVHDVLSLKKVILMAEKLWTY
tara:strand:+ start:8785 stop:9648 length:864 start_codon:yes stop_codon:yes gene_type:complete